MIRDTATSAPPARAHVDPGQHRREPPVWDAGYVLLRTLANQIRAQAELKFGRREPVDVIDIGCGTRPYEPIFVPYSKSYVGVDAEPGFSVDIVARAESLPFEDNSFDCALCTQVLEHCSDPWAAAAEIFRVLRPGGVGFVSTHGVALYHSMPLSPVDDYWRWTHSGLKRMFDTTGNWSHLEVLPNGETASAFAYLIGRELEIVAAKLHVRLAAAPIVLLMNAAASNVDRLSKRLFRSSPPHLAPNYLVVATR
jgi:SAM-dependent methyltransferase